MVVRFAATFVSRCFARQFNYLEPARLNERFDVAVHGCHAEPRCILRGEFVHLGNVERTFAAFEHLSDRVTLSCIALHHLTLL
jgi:hypothetical protein